MKNGNFLAKRKVLHVSREKIDATWKDYFDKLLSADKTTDIDVEIEAELHPEISTAEIAAEEINVALEAVKPDNSPGLDGFTVEPWKRPKVRTYLKHFYIETFKG